MSDPTPEPMTSEPMSESEQTLTIDLSHLGRDVTPGDLLRIEHRDGRSITVQVVAIKGLENDPDE